MHKSQRFIMFLPFLFLFMPTLVSAVFFFDQGFQTAVVRTDYNATDEGTSTNPITISNSVTLYPCNDAILIFPCVKTNISPSSFNWAPTEYANSNFWSFNGGDTANNFWVLSLNNEIWWKHARLLEHSLPVGTPYNPGPPNLSLPRVEPGAGIMGFKPIVSTEAGENFYRAHLVVNHTFDNPNDIDALIDDELPQYSLPHMSIGAAYNRGNGSVLGFMNDEFSPSKVTWTSTIFDTIENSPPNKWASYHIFIATAIWEGKTRMVQVALFHESDWQLVPNGPFVELHWSDSTNGNQAHWNWQSQESFYYPGADIALFDAEDMASLCGFSMTRLRYDGTSAFYSVVLDDLFRCASDLELFDDDMPYTSVPITGIHWANELTGPNIALWTSVHNMRMYPPPNPCPLCSTASQTQSTEIYPPIAVGNNEIPNEVNLIAKRLRTSCEKSTACWTENKVYLDGRRREREENPNIFLATIRSLISLNMKEAD